jgi:hypothetical protein
LPSDLLLYVNWAVIQDTGSKGEEVGSGGGSQEIRSCEFLRSPLEADEAESGAGIPLQVMALFSARFHAPGLSR